MNEQMNERTNEWMNGLQPTKKLSLHPNMPYYILFSLRKTAHQMSIMSKYNDLKYTKSREHYLLY